MKDEAYFILGERYNSSAGTMFICLKKELDLKENLIKVTFKSIDNDSKKVLYLPYLKNHERVSK